MHDDPHVESRAKEAWQQATEEEKESALKQASGDIEQLFAFRGQKKAQNQPMEWPRSNAYYDDGTSIEGVPEQLKKASAQYAACLLAGYNWKNPPVLARIIYILEPITDPEEPLPYRAGQH